MASVYKRTWKGADGKERVANITARGFAPLYITTARIMEAAE